MSQKLASAGRADTGYTERTNSGCCGTVFLKCLMRLGVWFLLLCLRFQGVAFALIVEYPCIFWEDFLSFEDGNSLACV